MMLHDLLPFTARLQRATTAGGDTMCIRSQRGAARG
jgi:hypothetical protein